MASGTERQPFLLGWSREFMCFLAFVFVVVLHADVQLRKLTDLGVKLSLGVCCSGLAGGSMAVAGGSRGREDASCLWKSLLSSMADSPLQLRPRASMPWTN